MKIGILTFHRAINYGAVLQCFALYTILKKMGHDVEVIDYRPESIEKYRMLFRKKDFKTAKGFGKLRYLLSCVTLIPSKKKTLRKFDSFIKRYLTTSQQVQGIDEMPKYYDAIFFGSDQIWSPECCEGLDKVYFGQFSKGNTKFVAYAASIGRIELLQKEGAIAFGKYLNAFDRISVREKQLHVFLQQMYNTSSEIVCDPSLLLSADYYKAIATTPQDTNYVLLFDLNNDSNTYTFAKRIAQQIGSKVIEIKAITNLLRIKYNTRQNLSPQDFIGYVLNANCVVTNAFHGTVFSILLHKNFYTLQQKNNNDRSITLLNKIGLSHRLVNSNENVLFSEINFCDTDAIICKFRYESLSFITDCLLSP